MRQLGLLSVLLVLFGIVAGLCGCSSSLGPTGPGGGGGALLRPLELGPYPPAGQYYRYRDILDHQYVFSPGDGSCMGCYDPPASVTLQIASGPADTLEGTLIATNLRPHFAYQVKLEGTPQKPYPWSSADLADPRNWANKQIGSVGRWWCDTCGWNVTDSELRRHRGHWILGYVLFDFFITDINGNAEQPIHLDSSFHVLWRTDQRTPTSNDGPPREHVVTWSSEVYGPSSFPDTLASVYAEWEPSRPLPGQVTLLAGQYQCRLLLTEESFHNVPPELAGQFPGGYTNYADGGFWANALSDAEFAFTIVGPAMHVGDIAMGLQVKGSLANATATVLVLNATAQPVSGVTVAGAWSGVVSGSSSSVTDSTGRVTLSSPKTRASGTFTFTVTGLTKSGWSYDPSANLETSDSITR